MLILLPCKLGLAASPMIRDSDENNALIADKNLMNYSSSSLEYSEMLWKEKERETISEPFMVIHLGNYLEADNLMLMAFFFSQCHCQMIFQHPLSMQNGLGFALKFFSYTASEMSNEQQRSGNILRKIWCLPETEFFPDWVL